MNMSGSSSLMDLVVFLALAFALIFPGAWIVSPRLREWIEQPKYKFLENLRKGTHHE